MPQIRIIDPNVRAKEEIERRMKKFRPEFGNKRHIDILARYNDILWALTLQRRNEVKKEELKKELKESNIMRKKMEQRETELLRMLHEYELSTGRVSSPQDNQQL